jgi:hypothetical protein
MSKTTSAIVIALVCLLFFPMIIGIVGGVFGIVFGVIGGLFGAVFGILGGLFGIIFEFIGWLFGGIFDWDWDGPFHTDWNFFSILIVVIIIALIAKNAQRDNPSKR